MAEPVVFISHFMVRDGALEGLRRFAEEGEAALREGKPQTVAFLMYLDDENRELTIVHTFPDADAMDRHFEGSDERSAASFEFLEPRGFEIYGKPSDAALATLLPAADAGLPLTLQPQLLRGFLRLRPD
jgi:hypothetical protein